jgi:hypothetical protein
MLPALFRQGTDDNCLSVMSFIPGMGCNETQRKAVRKGAQAIVSCVVSAARRGRGSTDTCRFFLTSLGLFVYNKCNGSEVRSCV